MKFPSLALLILCLFAVNLSAQELQPRVAIIHDRQIDILNLPGEIEYTIDSHSYSFISAVVWSPDGQSIAYDVADESFRTDIRIQHLDNGGVITIGSEDTSDTPILWHPTRGLTYEAQIRRDTRTIMTYDLSADEYTNWTTTLPEYADRVQADSPAWSPDGRYLAYLYGPKGTNNALIIQDMETQTYQAVEFDTIFLEFPANLQWIDDNTLLFTAACDILLYELADNRIIDLTVGGYCEGSPAVSAAGQIAYVNGNQQLWLMDEPQAIIDLVTDIMYNDGFFFWHPDGVLTFNSTHTGEQIVYESYAQLLTEYEVLSGSPMQWLSTDQLAFVSAQDGDSDIYILNLATDEIINLTHNNISDTFVSWWLPPETVP